MRNTQRIGPPLLGMGILCALAAVIAFASSRAFVTRAHRAGGVVVSVSEKQAGAVRGTVSFRTADKKEVRFVSRLNGTPSRRRAGKRVRVIYDPEDPGRARLDSFRSLWLPVLLFGSLALSAGGPGIWLVAANARRTARRRWVERNGRPVATEFHTVITNTAVSRHGEHPYRIVTHWKNILTGIHYTFEGPDTWFDPEPYAARRPIIVRIDPRDPTCYHMDVSFLPGEPPEQEESDTREPVAGSK